MGSYRSTMINYLGGTSFKVLWQWTHGDSVCPFGIGKTMWFFPLNMAIELG